MMKNLLFVVTLFIFVSGFFCAPGPPKGKSFSFKSQKSKTVSIVTTKGSNSKRLQQKTSKWISYNPKLPTPPKDIQSSSAALTNPISRSQATSKLQQIVQAAKAKGSSASTKKVTKQINNQPPPNKLPPRPVTSSKLAALRNQVMASGGFGAAVASSAKVSGNIAAANVKTGTAPRPVNRWVPVGARQFLIRNLNNGKSVSVGSLSSGKNTVVNTGGSQSSSGRTKSSNGGTQSSSGGTQSSSAGTQSGSRGTHSSSVGKQSKSTSSKAAVSSTVALGSSGSKSGSASGSSASASASGSSGSKIRAGAATSLSGSSKAVQQAVISSSSSSKSVKQSTSTVGKGQTAASGSSASGQNQNSARPRRPKCTWIPVCGSDGFTYPSDCHITNPVYKACDGYCPCPSFRKASSEQGSSSFSSISSSSGKTSMSSSISGQSQGNMDNSDTQSTSGGAPPPPVGKSGTARASSKSASVGSSIGMSSSGTARASSKSASVGSSIGMSSSAVSMATSRQVGGRRRTIANSGMMKQSPGSASLGPSSGGKSGMPKLSSGRSRTMGGSMSGMVKPSLTSGRSGSRTATAGQPPKRQSQLASLASSVISSSRSAGTFSLKQSSKGTGNGGSGKSTSTNSGLPRSSQQTASVSGFSSSSSGGAKSNGESGAPPPRLGNEGSTSMSNSRTSGSASASVVSSSITGTAKSKANTMNSGAPPPVLGGTGTPSKASSSQKPLAGGKAGPGTSGPPPPSKDLQGPPPPPPIQVTAPPIATTSSPFWDCGCPNHFVPVCGTDGEVYYNECELMCSGISKACDGECPCKKKSEQAMVEAHPVELPPPEQYPSATEAPFCSCPVFSYNPVCGVDGQTYDNMCLLHCEGVYKHCDGPCPCLEGGRKYRYELDGPCNHCSPWEWDPVCGTDGQTYRSLCYSKCHGAELQCSSECPC